MATTFPTTIDTATQLFTAVNGIATTLNGAIGSGALATINVADTTNFPSVGYFVVESEVISYTGKTGTSFTGCTRGADGTAAAAHSSLLAVNAYAVADHHNALMNAIIAIETDISARLGIVAGSGAIVVPNAVTVQIKTLNLGASGTVGTLNIFPATASKGKVAVTTSDNAGNTTTAINVAAQAAARTYTVPDAGQDASFVMSQSSFLGFGQNRLINGAMRIDQRNEGTSLTVTGTANSYSVDRWAGYGQAADGDLRFVRSTSTPPTGFSHFLRCTINTADASIGSGQQYGLVQLIEGSRVYDLAFGGASAKAITISFWVRSTVTGAFSGAVQNSAQDRSYPFSYTINAANTWEQKTVTIAGDTTGTWLTTVGIGLGLYFDLGSGTSMRGTVNTWAGSNFKGVTGAVSLVSTVNATWDITGVQLEAGSLASPFEYRADGVEYELCYRYFEKSMIEGVAVGTSGSSNQYVVVMAQFNTTSMESAIIPFKAKKRATPTVTLYKVDGSTNNWDFVSTSNVTTARATTAPEITQGGFAIRQTVAVEYMGLGHWVATAEL